MDCPRNGAGVCPACRDRHRAYARTAYHRHKAHRNKERDIRRRTEPYGITVEQRTLLFEETDGLCAMCLEVPATVVDHDHQTGKVRGALCHACNLGLGHFERWGGAEPVLEYLGTSPSLGYE